jgi:transcriptional regulator with XRE-family HTH domain
MDTDARLDGRPGVKPVGLQLRHWRQQRRRSQMDLALDAEVSPRHLSCVETGKARPSREMVLRLAEQLDVPLRERNAMLLAAGYAPAFPARRLDDPALGPAMRALQQLLAAHEPAPALAVDGHWNLVAANRMVGLLMQGVAPELAAPPVNVLRLSLHPQGLAPMIENLPAWRAHVLQRLQRQAALTGDATLAALHEELRALPLPAHAEVGPPVSDDAVIVPLALRTPHGRLAFLTTVTMFGAPHDLTLAELAVETLLPADAGTAAALRKLLASLPPPQVDAEERAGA